VGPTTSRAFSGPAPAPIPDRRQRDFSDAERDLLNRARPFLIRAYRNALSFAGLAAGGGANSTGLLALLEGQVLTTRQAQVVAELAHGGSNQDIGATLGISSRTVQKHLEHAFASLGVRSRSQAADHVWALARGRR
jgi:DNA-binding NarL/FixJ family response regulator